MAMDLAEDGLLDAGSPRGIVAWTPVQYACALGDQAMLDLLMKDGDASATGNVRLSRLPQTRCRHQISSLSLCL